MKSIHLSISKKTILSIKSITMHITTKISKKTVLFLITAILLLSGFASFFVMPRTANASFLSICDWLDVLPQKAQKGLIDTNPSDVGPIAGLQQVISEPDLLAKMEAIGKYQHGRFDKPTEILLGLWQKKHGVVENAQDTEYGKVGEKTMRVLKRYCGGYVSARGTQIVPDGPQISYTLFYPTKDGTSFVSKKVKLPKYTVRIADQALRALFNGVGVDRSVACSPFNANDTFGCGFTITTDSRSPWLGAAYRGVTLSDGQATVVFDKKALPFFETAQISHLVYTSIQKTLTQFSTIQTVRIKIKDLGQHGTGRIVKVIEDSKEVNKKENSIYVNSSLTTNQINAIITLLQSFGADQMTINKVRASLTGQMSYSTSSNTSYSANNNLNTNRSNKFCPNLYRNLYLGTKGQDVRDLQLYLRQEGFYNYPEITGYFGPATMRAVQRFQSARGIISYGSPESTGFGVVGPRTRKKMECGAPRSYAQEDVVNSLQQYVGRPYVSVKVNANKHNNMGLFIEYRDIPSGSDLLFIDAQTGIIAGRDDNIEGNASHFITFDELIEHPDLNLKKGGSYYLKIVSRSGRELTHRSNKFDIPGMQSSVSCKIDPGAQILGYLPNVSAISHNRCLSMCDARVESEPVQPDADFRCIFNNGVIKEYSSRSEDSAQTPPPLPN